MKSVLRFWLFMAVLGTSFLVTAPAKAALPELRISPLRYDQHLELGQTKIGIIDASNPTGSTIHVTFQVMAFRQIGDKGALEYYNDERIAAAVTPAVPEFDLGPREAIRTRFTIDPNKLGEGGAYGVIFLKTSNPVTSSSQINTNVRVGTLLILDVGNGGTKSGKITGLSVPKIVYGGKSLTASYRYVNTGFGPKSLAFASKIVAKVGWKSQNQIITGPFVFPASTRQTNVKLVLGNQIGFVPITLTDSTGGHGSVTQWAFVVAGFWTWLFLLICGLIITILAAIFWGKLRLPFAEKT